MKSTLKVHNLRVIILLICINDVQVCNNYYKGYRLNVVAYLSENSCTEPFRFANLTDGCLEGLKLMHTLENI